MVTAALIVTPNAMNWLFLLGQLELNPSMAASASL